MQKILAALLLLAGICHAKTVCPTGMIWNDCGTMCPPTCSDPEPQACAAACNPACECPSEKVQHHGACITRDACPTVVCQMDCQNGGHCDMKEDGQPGCICAPGFQGDVCEEVITEDDSSQCTGNMVYMECGSMCEPTCAEPEPSLCPMGCKVGCQCPDTAPVLHNGGCITKEACPEPTCHMQCQNGGRCGSLGNDSFGCICQPGFRGFTCEEAIEAECRMLCENGGRCAVLEDDSQGCVCLPGFLGLNCEQEVQVECHMTCLNGGHCEAGACVCQQGYRGFNCEEAISADCRMLCENGGHCGVMEDGSQGCVCLPGFLGLNCEQEVQVECRMTCLNGGHCEAGACVCQQGYRGLNCEEVVPDTPACTSGLVWMDCGSMCEKTCDDPEPQLCPLACRAGCFCPETAPIMYNGACITRDSCPPLEIRCHKSCMNGGLCQKSAADLAECVCPDGFEGEICEIKTGTVCIEGMVWNDCGSMCETTCDSPDNMPCQMGCKSGCQCPPHLPIWKDKKCISKPECPPPEPMACTPNPCENDGECVAVDGAPDQYSCKCTDWYEGTRCSSLRRYNCQLRNPCRRTNLLYRLGVRYFPGMADGFVQCSDEYACFEMPCPAGLVWNWRTTSCDWP